MTLDRLAAFVERGLDWIDAHLEEFDPFKNDQAFEIRFGQRVGELAILLRAYLRLTGRVGDRRATRMAALLWRTQCDPEFIARLIRSPLEFILFAEVYASLRAVGRDDPETHALIQRALDAGFLEQTERFPNRMMDIRACLDLGGFEAEYPSLTAVYDRSILTGRLDPLLLSQADLYAVTHVLMFLYDFGTRENDVVPESTHIELERLLPGLLVVVGQERHWDLLAELLICWECLRLPVSEVSERAWEELERLQDAEGAVPGPEWAARLHEETGQASRAVEIELYFSHHYHTTLVCLIVAFLRARRAEGRDQLAPRRETSRSPERRSRLAGRLEAARGASSWLDQLTDEVLSEAGVQAGVLGQLVLGHWLVGALAGDPVETAAPRICRIGERLAQLDAGNELTWSETPPTQSLLVAALLESHDVFVPYLHDERGFVSRVAKALQPLSASQTHDPALTEPRVILQQLGRLAGAPALDAQAVVAFAETLRPGASQEELDTLLDLVEAHTACGTQPSQLPPQELWTAELLTGVVVYNLRRYDFVRGARLIRVVGALEPLDQTNRGLLDRCVDFVLLNQRPDGAFGFTAPEARALEKSDPEFEAERALTLPVTVNCLWALAEAGSEWRLFSSLAC